MVCRSNAKSRGTKYQFRYSQLPVSLVSLPSIFKKGKGPFYLTSVVPSVLQTRDCYQWKPTVRPRPPLPLSVLRFTGIQSYTRIRGKSKQTLKSLKIEPGTSRSESRALANKPRLLLFYLVSFLTKGCDHIQRKM